MILKNKEELEILKQGGKILAKVLHETSLLAKQGITTRELNDFAEKRIFELDAKPSFKGYEGYPFSICTSINHQVVHGQPSDYVLKNGDVLGIDIGIEYKGYFLDAALTKTIGKALKQADRLVNVCKKALDIGVKNCKTGKRLGDLGFAIQNFVEGRGFKVIKDLAGHGVGESIHESPLVPNFGTPGKGKVLEEGEVLAIEPMIAISSDRAFKEKDGFAYDTADGSVSAHFEHTVLVTKKGGVILTKV